MQNVDVVVVGGGVMGSAAAWALSRAGREVVLLERFAFAHHEGASHGATRNFNMAYDSDAYLDLVVEARTLWDTLAAESGTTVLDLVGLVNHGPGFGAVAEKARARGLRAEWVTAAEARERWPGIRFASDALFLPDSGRVRAADALAAFRDVAVSRGAVFRYETPVRSIVIDGAERVVVETDSETYVAKRVVLTAGAWTQKIAGDLVGLPELRVTQEQPAHFAVTDTDATWPSFNHRPGAGDDWWPSAVYGMLTPGEGVKAGWHAVGVPVDPDARTYVPEPGQLRALQRYAREWLPGVDPDAFEPISCTYTLTPSQDFVLDARGPVVIGAGFSGHGFKFAPAIGRVLADLTEGEAPATLFRQLS